MSSDSNHVRRRDVLTTTAVGGLLGLAGCAGGGGSDEESPETTETGTGTGSGLNTDEEIARGGKPIIGLTNEPRAWNPLVTSDAAAFAIMDQFYLYPTARDPQNPNQTTGFLFQDWSFDPDSLTGTAQIVEGLTWTDGTDFTAEDIAFTYNYLKELEGHRYVQNVSKIKEIGTSGDYEIEFELQNEVAAVFTPQTGVFTVPTLPKQVWGDIEDYQEFEADTPLVGAGPYRWADADPGNWYELEARPDEFPDAIHPGPYVDRLRFRVFGDMTSLINALTTGDADMTYEGITPNRAFQLQDNDDAVVYNARSRGYNYVAHNMRRVPLDDRKFRQSLGFIYPFSYLKSSLRKGLTELGDYPAAKIYEPWRPDSFDDPIEHGPYKTESGELDVERARSFLTNANGKHDYTFGSVESSQVTGDQEIRVNGELLTEAHTDNDGNAGQGPLAMVITPPDVSPVAARASARFIENLNEVGIPAETVAVAENSQPQRIWGQEQFDMWESGWIWMPRPHFYLSFWLKSTKADVDSSAEGFNLNPMGYGNADDLIDNVENTFDPEQQKQYAKEALARIYKDQPALITEYPNRLHATSTRFEGWVKLPGGISQNAWSMLNVRQADEG